MEFTTINSQIGKKVTVETTDGKELTGILLGFFRGDVGYYALDTGLETIFIMNHVIRSMSIKHGE